MLFSQGEEAKGYLAPVDRALFAAMAAGQMLTLSFDISPGQGADGSFSASASKTVAVPVDRLYEAFADAALRARWLSGDLEVATTVPAKTFRAGWEDGLSRIVAGFTAKGAGKAQVALQHEKLPDAATAAKLKAFWRDRLDALKTLLEG